MEILCSQKEKRHAGEIPLPLPPVEKVQEGADKNQKEGLTQNMSMLASRSQFQYLKLWETHLCCL